MTIKVEYSPFFEGKFNLDSKKIVFSGPVLNGKLMVAKAIAKEMKKSFVDLEKYVEEHRPRFKNPILPIEKLVIMRESEADCLSQILTNPTYDIISLGTSTNCQKNNERRFKNISLIRKYADSICLLPSPNLDETADILFERMKPIFYEKYKRTLMPRDKLEFKEDLRLKLPFYKDAEMVVYTGNAGLTEIINSVLGAINRA